MNITSILTPLIISIAASSILLPHYFTIFTICFLLILLFEIVVLKPSRNSKLIFYILAGVVCVEYFTLLLLRPLPSVLVAILVQILFISITILLISRKYFFFSWYLKNHDINTTLNEGIIIKYLIRYCLPIEVLTLAEDLYINTTGADLDFFYTSYSTLKTVVAIGLFILLYELIRIDKPQPRF